MTMKPIWKDRPYWRQAGYSSLEDYEANYTPDFARAQSAFAPQAFRNMEHVQREVKRLNAIKAK